MAMPLGSIHLRAKNLAAKMADYSQSAYQIRVLLCSTA